MKLHLPLFKAITAAIVPYIAMIAAELMLFKNFFAGPFLIFLTWFFAGCLYTHIFEWTYHNYALHKWPLFLRDGHMRHHELLNRENFRTRDPKRLEATTTNWYVFPLLFAIHYFIFITLFDHENTLAFFSGITFQFILLYETAHWLTHTRTSLDSYLEKIQLWQNLIQHHRIHHNAGKIDYNLNFNFSPPYLGDRIFGTYEKRRKQ